MKVVFIGLIFCSAFSAFAIEPAQLKISCFFKHQDGYTTNIAKSSRSFVSNNGGWIDNILSYPLRFMHGPTGRIAVKKTDNSGDRAILQMELDNFNTRPVVSDMSKSFSFAELAKEDQQLVVGNLTFICTSKPIAEEDIISNRYFEATDVLRLSDEDRLKLINILREKYTSESIGAVDPQDIFNLWKSDIKKQ